MIWNEILCIGDSLTYGARDEYGRSYPLELAKIMTDKTNEFYICHNYGINGETSSDLLRRSWNILKSNRDSKICLLMIGTNDTKKPTPLDIYEDNMRQLILSIRVNGMIPIVATLPDLKFTPYYAKNRGWILKYNKLIVTMSKKLDFLICEMDNLSEHLVDGVHFTNKGYKEIAKRWSKKILSLK